VRQAERVATRLAGLGIDRLVSSPMLRCVETADHIARATGQRVELLASAYEHRQNEGYLCFGSREILARYPDLVVPTDFGADDWPYGLEPLESAVERAGQFRVWLWAQAESRRWRQVAIVIHGAITRLILERLLDLPPTGLAALVTDNCSLCSLRLVDRRLQLLALNDVAHLAGDPEVDPLAGLTR